MRSPGRFGARMLLAAYVADLLIGDPASIPHPVRAIGILTARLEPMARRYAPRDPRGELIAGALLWIIVTGATWAATRATLRIAHQRSPRAGIVVALWLGQTTLATRNLLDEVRTVEAALARGNLQAARTRLARIVGRDTADLDESEIARAAIETLAESLCDGIVAPLCALAVAGVPGAMVFKAISTLDSMIGHPELPYTFFGRAAARADDLANFVPARVTALLIVLMAGEHNGHRAARVCLRDGSLHASPNAGRCEAAMAGALGVRLGGTNRYEGVANKGSPLGPEFRRPTTTDIRLARHLVFRASLVGAVLAAAARATVAWAA